MYLPLIGITVENGRLTIGVDWEKYQQGVEEVISGIRQELADGKLLRPDGSPIAKRLPDSETVTVQLDILTDEIKRRLAAAGCSPVQAMRTLD